MGHRKLLTRCVNGIGGHGFQKLCQSFVTHVRFVREISRITQKPAGPLHSLPVPWESIGMDSIGPFPESHGFNYLWVVVCRLTSMVHLIPVRTDTMASQLSWIYLREIVHLHGLNCVRS